MPCRRLDEKPSRYRDEIASSLSDYPGNEYVYEDYLDDYGGEDGDEYEDDYEEGGKRIAYVSFEHDESGRLEIQSSLTTWEVIPRDPVTAAEHLTLKTLSYLPR